MQGPDWAWYTVLALMLAGLAAALVGLGFLMWRAFRATRVWWRWPALIGVSIMLLGLVVSLGQILSALVGG